ADHHDIADFTASNGMSSLRAYRIYLPSLAWEAVERVKAFEDPSLALAFASAARKISVMIPRGQYKIAQDVGPTTAQTLATLGDTATQNRRFNSRYAASFRCCRSSIPIPRPWRERATVVPPPWRGRVGGRTDSAITGV